MINFSGAANSKFRISYWLRKILPGTLRNISISRLLKWPFLTFFTIFYFNKPLTGKHCRQNLVSNSQFRYLKSQRLQLNIGFLLNTSNMFVASTSRHVFSNYFCLERKLPMISKWNYLGCFPEN